MMERIWRYGIGILMVLAAAIPVGAEVKLASIFSDHAVLQRDMPVPVWGSADPGETVTVSFAGQIKSADADADGNWCVTLDPLAANADGQHLSATGKSGTAAAADVVVGEVWLASGQSNMDCPLWGLNPIYRHRTPEATGKMVADSTRLPLVRFVQMTRKWSPLPTAEEKAVWNLAVAGNRLEQCSAVAFFFGRKLHRELNVPIGLVCAHWGGSRIEPWIPQCGFSTVPELVQIREKVDAKIPGTEAYRRCTEKVIGDFERWLEQYRQAAASQKTVPEPPNFPDSQRQFRQHQEPTVIYNRMMYPLTPFALRGAIWYQGESNLADGMFYAKKLQALHSGWEQVFKNPRLKLYLVQLAPFTYQNFPEMLPRFWEAQQFFADHEPNAGMVVITDAVDNIRDIHPANKQVVGERLADLALNRDYGRTDIKADSPRLTGHKIVGDKFVLDFDHVTSWRPGTQPIQYFEISAVDQLYHPAEVEINGSKLIVHSPQVANPVNLRYHWHQTDQGRLANEAGRLLGAFRIERTPSADELLAYLRQKRQLIYEYDLGSGSGFGDGTRVRYITDHSESVTGKISAVTYLMKLTDFHGRISYVCIRLDAFTQDPKKLGVPVKSSGAKFQQIVSNLYVISNVRGVMTGYIPVGNIEFWPNSASPRSLGKIRGASGTLFDIDDIPGLPEVGSGSMQIHNTVLRQTIMGYSNFRAGRNADVGIGNQKAGNPDWTFSRSVRLYKQARLYVFVETE